MTSLVAVELVLGASERVPEDLKIRVTERLHVARSEGSRRTNMRPMSDKGRKSSL